MDRAHVSAFADRPWDEVEDAKAAYWSERWRREGPAATLAASDLLRAHLRCVRPEWPTEADRAADLEHHLRMRALLDRVADALAAR